MQASNKNIERMETSVIFIAKVLGGHVFKGKGNICSVYANHFHYASNFILREGTNERYSYVPAKNFGFYKYTGRNLYNNYLHEANLREYNHFFRELQRRADRELDLMR